ncbi:hypothetical protein GCM10022247_52810 [Allokutzneria multivorans]|uniref:Clp R domain-containing protein n=1 Tax=Allokutzneria multivorans TaxID=1142134 RepID=A0ABP7T7Y1_9PSEU
MTKFVMAANLSVQARDEASRWGHPQVDVEHLFLALLLSGGAAGKALRRLGITLERARDAVEAVHAERIGSLGIAAPAMPTGPIREPGNREIEFSERALGVIRTRDEVGIVRALVDEPSGLVEALLLHLGLTPAEVHGAIETAPQQPKLPRTAVHSGFIPAPVDTVWSLVSDPARRSEWDTAVASAEPVTDGLWKMTLTNGRGFTLRELSNVVRSLEWEVRWPGHWTPLHWLTVSLAEANGGTTITLTGSWERRWTPNPLRRFAMRLLLTAYATALSRALR